MYLSISDEERRRAIHHVVKNVPKETLLQIYEEISRDPTADYAALWDRIELEPSPRQRALCGTTPPWIAKWQEPNYAKRSERRMVICDNRIGHAVDGLRWTSDL